MGGSIRNRMAMATVHQAGKEGILSARELVIEAAQGNNRDCPGDQAAKILQVTESAGSLPEVINSYSPD